MPAVVAMVVADAAVVVVVVAVVVVVVVLRRCRTRKPNLRGSRADIFFHQIFSAGFWWLLL